MPLLMSVSSTSDPLTGHEDVSVGHGRTKEISCLRTGYPIGRVFQLIRR